MSELVPVSVVVPCFRCGATIRRAAASVAAQTARPAELILVDDASGDDTLRTLYQVRDELGPDWVRVITLAKNSGPSTARNAGWDAAKGEYVAFLDADDAWEPRKLEIQTRFMHAHSQFAMTAHAHRFDSAPQAGPPAAAAPFTEIRFRSLLYRNWFHPSSVMLRRDLPQRFDAAKRHGEDRQLWLDVAARQRIARIDVAMVTIFKPLYGASGLSADLWSMERAELATFCGLRQSGLIGFPLMCALLAWSLARFARRLLVVALRRGTG